MFKRSSSSRHKSSSISRTQARKAVLGVKTARTSTAKKASKSPTSTPSFVERYLGHFGVGSNTVIAKRGARKVGAAKKSSPAKKSSATKKSSAKKATRALKRAS